MKVYRNEKTAMDSFDDKETFFLNGTCPYSERYGGRLCGNWCALFYFDRGMENSSTNTSPFVILGCKAGEKYLYVETLVED